MSSLIGTSHLQLASFALGTIGWILCTVSMGLVEWRVWHVDNTTIISSGIAWVGIWKVCFISYIHVSPGYEEQFCHKFSGYDSSIPGEIYAAQGLLVIAMVMGLLGLTATICALRNIYMGISRKTPITRFFLISCNHKHMKSRWDELLHRFSEYCQNIRMAAKLLCSLPPPSFIVGQLRTSNELQRKARSEQSGPRGREIRLRTAKANFPTEQMISQSYISSFSADWDLLHLQ
uniref:Uncharacterized protein n=1 Tax=Pavo cristatus TaxID=9049 RepID=A0A8C9FUM2_PAVCR